MFPYLNMTGMVVGGSLLAGCIGAISEAGFGKAVAAECAVATVAQAGGQEVTGRIVSTAPTDGSYDLTVMARDAHGNMTTVQQGGRFVVPAGEEMVLEAVQVGPDSDVAASMVVTLGGGSVLACDG